MSSAKPASVHVKRHLARDERATIAAALEYFTNELPVEEQLERIATYDGEQMPLSPYAAEQLGHELMSARKVKVCRSKRTSMETRA